MIKKWKCVLLNTDLGSVFDANAEIGSISTATDEDVDAGNDEGSCTYIGRRRSGQGASNLRLFWFPAGLWQRRIQSGWKHHLDHCSAIETLLI